MGSNGRDRSKGALRDRNGSALGNSGAQVIERTTETLKKPQKRCLLRGSDSPKPPLPRGAVAQLIERVVRNDEVVGLIPICSTILRSTASG